MKTHLRLILIILLIVNAVSTGLVLAQDEPTPVPDGDEVNVDVQVDPDQVEQAAGDAVQLTEDAAEGTMDTVRNFLDDILEAPNSQIMQVLLVVGGVVLLVAGWRIYEFVIILSGILIGASIAASVVVTTDTVIEIAAILIGGLLGAILAAVLYYVAVFLIGAYVGLALTNAAAVGLNLTPVSSLVLLTGAIIGGLILLGLSFQFLIFLSALVGAQMLALALGLGAEWVLILAILGIIIQIVAARSFGYSLRRMPRRRLRLI